MTKNPKNTSLIDHFHAMDRWRERAINELGSVSNFSATGICIKSNNVIDFANAFFVWAHSARDWVINSNSVSQQALDTELNQHSQWVMVRDLANKIKHKEITRNPLDADWFGGLKIDPNELLLGKQAVEPYIVYCGKYLPMKDCLDSVSAMWIEVLNNFGVKFDESRKSISLQGQNT